MSELIAALNQLEKEKGIDKDVIMEAIENSLLAACKRDFGSADNVVVNMDRETGDIYVYAIKEVVDEVYDPALEISLGRVSFTTSVVPGLMPLIVKLPALSVTNLPLASPTTVPSAVVTKNSTSEIGS